MKKIAAISAIVILVLCFVATGFLSAQPKEQPQITEKEIKDFQRMIFENTLEQMKKEKASTERIILKLGNYQTNDAELLEKISQDWLPFFKEYLKSIDCTEAALEKFAERKDLVSNQEVNGALGKCYSKQLEVDINRVLKEIMGNAVILEILRQR